MKAAIHLGENYNDNLFTYRNTNFGAPKTLFDLTQKLILNQRHEIRYVSTIEWPFATWVRSTLLHDIVFKLSKAKGTRLFQIRSFVWKDAQTSRSHGKVERTSLTFPDFQRTPRIIWKRRRTIWVRVDYFPRTYGRGDSQRDSDKNDSSQNKTWRIWRSDHVCGNDINWTRSGKYKECFFRILKW